MRSAARGSEGWRGGVRSCQPLAASPTEVARGIHRFCDGLVNWYAVEHDSGIVLVDSGWPGSRDVLARGLAAIGQRPGDVRALLLTHGHVDHLGCAAWLEEEHGVPIYAAAGELERVRGRRPDTRSPKLVLDLWRPSALSFVAGAFRRGLRAPRWPRNARAVGDAPNGALPSALRVIETPGHTEGHVAYHLADRGIVFSGDALVTRSVLTGRRGPQLHPAAFTVDAERARRSLEALAAIDAELMLPGHGHAFKGSPAEAAARAR
jgi:glyoxylase-like metal-dependent hydrolase (beta-lactamase superfamily II)